MRVTKFDRVVWWNCTRAAAGMPVPYSATLVEQALKARYTGLLQNSLQKNEIDIPQRVCLSHFFVVICNYP